jgi:hypothetical protein
MSGKKHIIVLTDKQLHWLKGLPMGSYLHDMEECGGTPAEMRMFKAVMQALRDTTEI